MKEIAVVIFIMVCLFMATREQKQTLEAPAEAKPVAREEVREMPKEPVVIEKHIIVEKPVELERPVNNPVTTEREVTEPVNYYAMGYSDEGNHIDRSYEVCQRYSACEQYEQGQRDRRYGR